MKTEFADVSATQKHVTIEIPSDEVDAQINRVTLSYGKAARIPGFRPGKAPTKIVKQRFKEQILQEVARDLVPKAVDEALQQQGVEPVDAPDVQDFAIDEGQPLRFKAVFETVPPIDPGDLSSITLRRPSATVSTEDVDRALERLRARAGRDETVEGRAVGADDSAILDIQRTGSDGTVERHDGVPVTLGAPGNPPGFDTHLVGMSVGDEKTFAVRFPEDYAVSEMANTEVTYAVTVREVRRRVLPDLDDEFAKDMGEFETLEGLRERVRADLQREAEATAGRQVRHDLLQQLSKRITFEVPSVLVDREVDRRVEEFVRQLVGQQIDPRTANLDWAQFRDAQREPARDTVASALVLDEIAKREALVVTSETVDREIEGLAERLGHTPAAVRAQLEKDGGIARMMLGLRREMAVNSALRQATTLRAD